MNHGKSILEVYGHYAIAPRAGAWIEMGLPCDTVKIGKSCSESADDSSRNMHRMREMGIFKCQSCTLTMASPLKKNRGEH